MRDMKTYRIHTFDHRVEACHDASELVSARILADPSQGGERERSVRAYRAGLDIMHYDLNNILTKVRITRSPQPAAWDTESDLGYHGCCMPGGNSTKVAVSFVPWQVCVILRSTEAAGHKHRERSHFVPLRGKTLEPQLREQMVPPQFLQTQAQSGGRSVMYKDGSSEQVSIRLEVQDSTRLPVTVTKFELRYPSAADYVGKFVT